jgi:cell shape-determining protein MreD
MRWIPFIVLIYLVLAVQTTLGAVLTFSAGSLGRVGPDWMAVLVVFVALHTRSGADAAIGAWVAGLAVDLATAGGTGAITVVGPMPIAYVLGAAVVFRMREAFFRERAVPQAMLGFIFCLIAHWTWLTLQSFLARGAGTTWSVYGGRLLQGAALGVYTAVLTPIGHLGLTRIRGWIIAAPLGRARRRRR